MTRVVSCRTKRLRVQSHGVFATPAAACEMFVKQRTGSCDRESGNEDSAMTPRILLLKTAACVFCAALFFIRVRLTGSTYFSFMLWNLFLAALPLVFAWFLPHTRRLSRAIPLLAIWLLFFPNAPYVLTDLIHLKPRAGIPLWYDLLMLLSFALTSLWIGFHSLHMVHQWIARHVSVRMGWLVVLAVMPLTGFGIYLGRVLRWNSWDIISNPFSMLRDIATLALHPLAHRDVWLFTFGFSLLLMFCYLAWRNPAHTSEEASAR